MRVRASALALGAWGVGAVAASAAPQSLPFADGGWQLEGAAKIERVDGRDVVSFETGFAYRRDIRLEDGTIDFDVKTTRRRSFVYVHFRMADEREQEEMYLRPHKAGLPDAVQYAPTFQGQSAWQLYHGAAGTAAVDIVPDVWTHVRVVLQGRRAALFVGDLVKPAMVVPRLAREPRPGFIALSAFLPADTPGAGAIARFANVTVQPGVVPFDFASVPVKDPDLGPGVIRAWTVSENAPALATKTAVPVLPDLNAIGPWRRAEIEPLGFVNLHRYVTLPTGTREGTTVVRTRVRATQAGVRAFDLGFSDTATVFLNAQPLFYADERYTYDLPRREGLIGFDQARLYLPLVAGDNDVVVIVSDRFGGWAVMGRFPDPAGLAIQ